MCLNFVGIFIFARLKLKGEPPDTMQCFENLYIPLHILELIHLELFVEPLTGLC